VRVLIFGINFSPELTGIGKYSGELGAYFAECGDEVEVITAPPYYPQWQVQLPYNNGWSKENLSGVTVLRCPLYVPREQTGIRRIMHEITFIASSLRWWVPRMFRQYDVLISISPPFHLPFLPLIHKFFHGTPVVNHIQDLQVDAARELGLIRGRSVLRVLEGVERWLLSKVNLVSTISAGMALRIREKNVPSKKQLFFPNWVDNRVVYPVAKNDSLRKRFGISNETKVILYAGNLGQKQGLELIPSLAKRFETLDGVDVLFLIVGSGGAKQMLIDLVATNSVSNVQFEGLQPLDDLAAMLAVADVHLVLQKKAAADLVMPSKLTNIVASGGHALVTAEPGTTLHNVLVSEKIGTLAEPENEEDIFNKIRDILSGNLCSDIQGLSAFAKTLDRDIILNQFRADMLELSSLK